MARNNTIKQDALRVANLAGLPRNRGKRKRQIKAMEHVLSDPKKCVQLAQDLVKQKVGVMKYGYVPR
jgi:hypothetical protein